MGVRSTFEFSRLLAVRKAVVDFLIARFRDCYRYDFRARLDDGFVYFPPSGLKKAGAEGTAAGFDPGFPLRFQCFADPQLEWTDDPALAFLLLQPLTLDQQVSNHYNV